MPLKPVALHVPLVGRRTASAAASHVEIGSLDRRYGVRLHTDRLLDTPCVAVSHLTVVGAVDHAVAASIVQLLDGLMEDIRVPFLELTVTDVVSISPLNAHWVLGAAGSARRHGGEFLVTGPVLAEPLRRALASLKVPSQAFPRCDCQRDEAALPR